MGKDYVISKKTGNIIYTKAELPEAETRLVDLARGAEPTNESEREMVKQMDAIKASGKSVDIPSM